MGLWGAPKVVACETALGAKEAGFGQGEDLAAIQEPWIVYPLVTVLTLGLLLYWARTIHALGRKRKDPASKDSTVLNVVLLIVMLPLVYWWTLPIFDVPVWLGLVAWVVVATGIGLLYSRYRERGGRLLRSPGPDVDSQGSARR